jgi:hypothetical protein
MFTAVLFLLICVICDFLFWAITNNNYPLAKIEEAKIEGMQLLKLTMVSMSLWSTTGPW